MPRAQRVFLPNRLKLQFLPALILKARAPRNFRCLALFFIVFSRLKDEMQKEKGDATSSYRSLVLVFLLLFS